MAASNVNPLKSPDGTLLGWLKRNYPDTYAELQRSPAHRLARQRDYKDSKYARKHPSRSGRLP